MKIIYDPQVDALRISLLEEKAVESEEVLPDVIFDYSEDGKIVSIEVLHASAHLRELTNIDKLAGAKGRQET